MSYFTFTAPKNSLLTIAGNDASFPVRRIYCIGRNYAEHSIEMGGTGREEPFFFQKNPDNADQSGTFPYPDKTDDVHHEIEMVVALKSGGRNIPVDEALDCVFGYGVGLDMTRRDLQAQMKEQRRPWEIGKAFENSAPMGPLIPADECGHMLKGAVTLMLNGEQRQSGDLDQMIWKVPEMISYLSDYFEIAAGDIIMTGTPAGVGPVERGDVLIASIEGLGEFEVAVV